MLRGIGTSKGIGIGHALVLSEYNEKIEAYNISDCEAEKKRFLDARNSFIKETEELVCKLSEKLGSEDKNALILKNQIYLINDAEMVEGVNSIIDSENICSEAALRTVCDRYIKIFMSMDSEAMNQRAADIEDMCNRVIQILNGVKKIDLTKLMPGTIIVAKEIHPSMTAGMDADNVAGIVSEKGGDTSHAAILARALEIPAVLSVKNVCELIKDDDSVIVDGAYGEVFVNPIPKTVEIYNKKKKQFEQKAEELKKYIDKQTMTADGKEVMLAANIGNADDAIKAVKDGAEGVGLFRTEFLFMNGISMPTEEEQFENYRRAAVILKGRPLTIRTLDIGGDKDIPYMGLVKETNPFLGYRAIRFCLDRVDIFTTQLRAILRASAYGKIRIMIPMITSVSEVLEVKKLIEKICKNLDAKGIAYDKSIEVGIMIETPAAAVMADVLAKEVDFFSIGTNDLTQYTIAVDRGNENVSYLYSPFNPAVLRLIKYVIKCGHDAGIDVGMCGEAAGNEAMLPLLLSFGLDEYSVTASKILETRKNIASWTLKDACDVAANAMNMSTEKEISNYLSDIIAQ